MTRLPMSRLSDIFTPYVNGTAPALVKLRKEHPEKAMVADHIATDLCLRLTVLLDLGLGYLAMERSTPTLSPGELPTALLAARLCEVASDGTGAPHEGQFMVSGVLAMGWDVKRVK